MMIEAENNSTLNGTLMPSVDEVPLKAQVGLVILYVLTALLSILGNLLVIVIFFISSQSKTALRTFLANLALSDLVMAIFCMPFTFSYTMLNRWVFGPCLCTLVLYMQSVAVTASVGTSTAIAVDRYIAVKHPLRRVEGRNHLRKWFVVVLVWFLAAAISSVQLGVGRLKNYNSTGGIMVTECTEEWPEPEETWRSLYTFFILVMTCLLPLFAIAVAYGIISHHLWKQKAPGNPDEQRDALQLKSKRKVIKMLVIVVTLFGVCWIPLHLFTIILDFNPQFRSEGKTNYTSVITTIYVMVHWLAMSNSFVNPIVYSFLNDSFRNDLKRMFRRLRPTWYLHSGQENVTCDQLYYLPVSSENQLSLPSAVLPVQNADSTHHATVEQWQECHKPQQAYTTHGI